MQLILDITVSLILNMSIVLQSLLDDAWNVMFRKVYFARHLTGPVCFDHLVFSPLGYSSLFRGVSDFLTCRGCVAGDIPNDTGQHPTTPRVREFG